jgi:hypothetical protein
MIHVYEKIWARPMRAAGRRPTISALSVIIGKSAKFGNGNKNGDASLIAAFLRSQPNGSFEFGVSS